MQVATLFGENVKPFVSTSSTMNTSISPSSESVCEEKNDTKTIILTDKVDATELCCNNDPDHLPISSTPLSSSPYTSTFTTTSNQMSLTTSSKSSDVSSLVNYKLNTSVAGNESQQIKETMFANDVNNKDKDNEKLMQVNGEEFENNIEQIVPTNKNISSNENEPDTIPKESSNRIDTRLLVENEDDSALDCAVQNPSTSYIASVEMPDNSLPSSSPKQSPVQSPSKYQTQPQFHSHSPSSVNPATDEVSLETNANFISCVITNKESSCQEATTLLFQETFLQHEKNQNQEQEQTPGIESCQIQQNNEIPSAINQSNNIIETNGCATNNLSDMSNLEAENLVINRNNNDNNSNHNNNNNLDEIKQNVSSTIRLFEDQTQSNGRLCENENQQVNCIEQQQQHQHFQRHQQHQQQPMTHEQLCHSHELEFERLHQQQQQHQHQQMEQQDEQMNTNSEQLGERKEIKQHDEKSIKHKDEKQHQFSLNDQFHECHHNDINVSVDELSQGNIRHQQNSMDTNNIDDYKLQNVPENLQILNQMNQQQHHQHFSQGQHHLGQNIFQHDQHPQQQLYLHHQDQQQQQHTIHQQHQHLHHQQLQLQHPQHQQHQQHQQQQHQQDRHHSELMAYLHHQDQQQQQQSLQQSHHMRTYQHYQQQHKMHQFSQLAQHPQHSQHSRPLSPLHQPKHTSVTCIDDLMIDDLQEDPNNRYKLLSPTVKHESQDDGYETSAGDVLTPNSHTSTRHSMTPQHQLHTVNLMLTKCEDMSSAANASRQPDPSPYNFIEDEINSNMRMMSSPSSSNGLSMVMRQQNFDSPNESTGLLMDENNQVAMNVGNQQQQIIDSRMQAEQTHIHTDRANILPISRNASSICGVSESLTVPKKRGRKKKGSDEMVSSSSMRTMVDGMIKPILPKERKKHDRFNGMPEEEVSKRTLPDHLADNLDIIIIGINPGLFAAYKGHHYAGPGNHFWKCLYLSGLTQEQMTAEEDSKLLEFGIGFTNMVERATKGSADLTRKEIKEGSRILLEKLKRFRPKIAVFNGKLIFEVFSGKKDFNFGRQQECVEGTDTYMWVMPSSSARCAQLPRAADKVPFYAALKKFRDYLNGLIPHIDDIECVFNDQKLKQCCETDSVGGTRAINPPSPSLLSTGGSTFLSPECLAAENQNLSFNNSNCSTPESNAALENSNLSLNHNKTSASGMNLMNKVSPIMDSMITNNSDNGIRCGMLATPSNLSPSHCNSVLQMTCNMDQSAHQIQPGKKKRGRPKKIKGIDGEDGPAPQKIRNTNSMLSNNSNVLNLTLMSVDTSSEIPKKKRGRPKKIKSDITINLNHEENMSTGNSNNCNTPHQLTNNNKSKENTVSKSNIGLHRDSPNHSVSHQGLSLNNTNHSFNSQQRQPMQNQRLFNSPMHSPSNLSSYCPISLNTANTPPSSGSGIGGSNNTSEVYHHQQQQQQLLASSHLMQSASHQNNHNLQQHVQHQLHIPSLLYMHSSNHNVLSSESPHYGSSHSDLSTEISAAISSDHLTESQSASASASSPVVHGAADYDRPDSIPNDEHSAHDIRFPSPTPNPESDQTSMGGGASAPVTPQHTQQYHNIYPNPSSNQSYLSSNNMNNPTGESSAMNGTHKHGNENINYIASNRPNTSNSNNSTTQPIQQKNMQLSDVTSKSLSGLESLVDQIPTMAENDNSSGVGIKTDSNEDFPSPSSGGSRAGSSNSSGGGLGCLYMPSYSNINSSSSSSPSAVAIATPIGPPPLPPSNSSILSPQNYPDPIYSAANTCHSSPNANTDANTNNNLNNYNSITSNFSVSTLTSNNYPSNLYHSNLIATAAASSPHHIISTASGSPMYMEPHPHMAVSPIYHHPYAHTQHGGYGHYTSVGPPPPPPPTLHMPSPNYPYAAYPNTSGYPNSQHPSHTSPAAYLTSHPSMFDRIKPDIGYGGY